MAGEAAAKSGGMAAGGGDEAAVEARGEARAEGDMEASGEAAALGGIYAIGIRSFDTRLSRLSLSSPSLYFARSGVLDYFY